MIPNQRSLGGPRPPASIRTRIAAGFFFLLAIAATFPLALRFRTALPAGSGDLFVNVWNFWWWKKALLELHTSPYYTRFLYAPDGLDLTFHTHSPFNMLALMPVNVLWGPVAAYNAAVILSLFLCGLGAFLLLRELTGDDLAALGGGIVFALFPQHLEHTFEHLNLMSCQFMPFTLYHLIRVLRYGRARDGILTGIYFALNALASWHLGILLALIGLPVGIGYGWTSPARGRSLRWLCLGGALSALILLPFAAPLLADFRSEEAYFIKQIVYKPVDPAFLVLPPPQSTFLGRAMRDLYLTHRGTPLDAGAISARQYIGFICFLGWIPVSLAAYLATRLRRGPGRGENTLWFVLFAAFLVLSLGRSLTFFGTAYPAVSLPQGWLQELPVFRLLRVANRFLIPGGLAFAVLVAGGLARLPRRPALRCALILGILLEFLWLPFPVRAVSQHPYMREIAGRPDTGIVLDIPPCVGTPQVQNMFRQTAHGAPIVGGYASCVPPQKRDALRTPAFLGSPLPERVRSPAGGEDFLRRAVQNGVRTILLKPSETSEALELAYSEGIRNGELPVFLKHLRPGGALARDEMAYLVETFRHHLGPPDYEDKDLMVWHIDRREAERLSLEAPDTRAPVRRPPR